MVRRWTLELTYTTGTQQHFIHDDGTWEWDPSSPLLRADDMADIVRRIDQAWRQGDRIGWTRAELRKLP